MNDSWVHVHNGNSPVVTKNFVLPPLRQMGQYKPLPPTPPKDVVSKAIKNIHRSLQHLKSIAKGHSSS